MSFSIFVLIFFDVEVEVEHPNELIGHLAHFLACAVHGKAVEDRLFLVSIQVELGCQSHGSVENPFRILLGDSCSILSGEL